MKNKNISSTLAEISKRIKEMREIAGMSVEEMAAKTDTTVEQYLSYETGGDDLPQRCGGIPVLAADTLYMGKGRLGAEGCNGRFCLHLG